MLRLNDLGQRSGAIAIDAMFDSGPLDGYARNRAESRWLWKGKGVGRSLI